MLLLLLCKAAVAAGAQLPGEPGPLVPKTLGGVTENMSTWGCAVTPLLALSWDAYTPQCSAVQRYQLRSRLQWGYTGGVPHLGELAPFH